MVALAQIIGISLAVIALLAEGAFTLGWQFSSLGVGLLLAGFAALAVVGFIRRKPQIHKRQLWIGLIGLALFGSLIAWRLHQADELILPNWVDSQHHYLIIRAILEQRGLPDTLAPYLDQPLYYHFGFHTATALFISLSGLTIGQAMLIFGQLLNATVSLSVYTLGKNALEGLAACACGSHPGGIGHPNAGLLPHLGTLPPDCWNYFATARNGCGPPFGAKAR